MKNKKGLSVAELTIVIIILGMICSFCIPIIIKESAAKIRSTQYYAAYKTLADGAKHVKLNSPTHDFSVFRGGKFRVSACDLFADTFSVAVDSGVKPVEIAGELVEVPRDLTPISVCPDGEKTIDGKCEGLMIALGDRCQDGSAPTCAPGETSPCEAIYCKVLPKIINLYNSCDDGTYFAPWDNRWAYGESNIPDDFYSGKNENYVLPIDDKTNFDTENPNFTTLNGIRFFGLDKYPQEQFCTGKDIKSLKKAHENDCLLYKAVYVDINGVAGASKSGKPCESDCASAAMLDPDTAELADGAQQCLECMRSNFGVYKFHLYNDGRIEPLTNRDGDNDASRDERIRFVLSYVQNGKVIHVSEQFLTYQDARDYTLSRGEKFTYWKPTELGDGSVYNVAGSWDEVSGVTQPCKTGEDFKRFECEIKLITPEMQLSRSVMSR